MQKKYRSTTVLEEILLDFHHHLARLARLIQEYLFAVKKEFEPTLKNSAEIGLFVTHSFSFVYSNSK